MIIKRSAMFFGPYQATTVLDIKLKYYWWGYSRWCKTILKPRANGRNIVGCYMLRPFAHPVACCCVLLRKVWNRSNFSANNSQHFFCSVIAEAWRNNVGSVCTALPTLLGPHTLITHGLQRLMGCIGFFIIIVGSCCIRLHTTANTHAITLKIVGATMLGVVAPVCTQP